MNPFGSHLNMDPFAQMNQLMNATFPMQSNSLMNSHQSMHNALMPASFGQPMMMSMFNDFNGGGMFQMNNRMMQHHNQMHTSMMQHMNMPSMNNMMMSSSGSSSSFHQQVSFGQNGRETKSYSMSQRTGPNGVRETRQSQRDSTTGLHKIEIGHHIGDRGHVIGRSRNTRTGEQEQNQHFQNIDEDEAEEFNQEYMRRANGGFHGNSRQTTNQQPALTYRSTYNHPKQ